MNVSNGMLARLTLSKAISNISFRWLAFFLPTLVVAFSATTSQLTTILGIGEMVGLATIFAGRVLDQDRERAMIVFSLILAALGLGLSAIGSLTTFALGYVVLMLGVALCSASGHTYLGRRVLYERRARAIGIFETSWASALLVGAPIAAVLISLFGWRGPFAAFAVAALVIATLVWFANDNAVLLEDATVVKGEKQSISRAAWLAIAASGVIAATGLTTVVIVGTWLDEAFGLSTEGIGLIAMVFGIAELVASTSSAAVADRVGPIRATQVAMVMTVVGLVVMTQAGSSLLIGALGLFVFFVGFEFSIVTSFTFVSEAMPSARGQVLAVNTAAGTVLRGFGASMSGVLFVAYGIVGPASFSIAAALTALLLLLALDRVRAEANTIGANV